MDETAPSPQPPPVPQRDFSVPPGTLCRRCSYDLANLPPTGVCPECGKPIEESLRGDLLIYADPAYLSQVRLGVKVILACILTSVVLTIGMLIATVSRAVAGLGPKPPWAGFLIGMITLLVSIVSIYGYFLFSTPDPGVDPLNKGDRPRRVLRAATLVRASLAPVAVIQQIVGEIGPASRWSAGPLSVSFGFLATLSLIAAIVGAVQFFAAMQYVGWLAPRIPNAKVFQRSQTYQWALPLWYIPGTCIVVGPLIALILYYNFFNDLRKHLDHIAHLLGSPPPEAPPPVVPGS